MVYSSKSGCSASNGLEHGSLKKLKIFHSSKEKRVTQVIYRMNHSNKGSEVTLVKWVKDHSSKVLKATWVKDIITRVRDLPVG